MDMPRTATIECKEKSLLLGAPCRSARMGKASSADGPDPVAQS
jgi:hypothetical protein